MKLPAISFALALVIVGLALPSLASDPRPKDAAEAFDPRPTDAEVLKAIDASNDRILLTALGRWKDQPEAFASILSYHSPVTLREGPHYLCLFLSAMQSAPGNNPRVVILLDRDLKVLTYTRTSCEPFFGYANIVDRTRNKETHLITVNRVSRGGGELWFERYKIEATGITKLGEGYDPMVPKSDEPSR